MAEYSKTQLRGMNKDELEDLANDLGVYPEVGSGADGAVLVGDLVDAIYDAQPEPAAAVGVARDVTVRCVGCGAVNVVSAVPNEVFTFFCGSCQRGDTISVTVANRG